MQTKSLTVALRDGQGKGAARKLRAVDKVPGVVYGKGQPARSVVLDRKPFELMIRTGGYHGLFDLSFETGGEPVKALIREVQVHPLSREVVHVDLQEISMTEKIRIEIPIVLLGKPEGVKTHGGILEHNLSNIEVECLPTAIPEKIEVDVSAMNIGQSVHVGDLNVPGVVFLAHHETSIATVSLPAAERAAEEAAAPAAEAEAAEGAEAKAGEKGESGEKPEKSEKAEAQAKPAKQKESKGGKS